MLTNILLSGKVFFDAPNDNGAGGDNANDDDEPDDLTVDQLKEMLKKTRQEAAKYRTRSKEFDKTQTELQKLKALEQKVKGIFGDDTDDPAEKLSRFEQENRTLKLERTISKAAKQHNADEELITPYLSHKGLLKDVDPTDSESISKLIEKAVKDNPKLLATPPPKTGDPQKPDPSGNKVDMNALIRKAAGRG